MQHDWKINYTDVSTSKINNLEQVVVSCRWELISSNNDIVVSSYGYSHFDEPNTATFISFSDLKPSDVLKWVWENVNKSDTETANEDKIIFLQNPPTVQMTLPSENVPS